MIFQFVGFWKWVEQQVSNLIPGMVSRFSTFYFWYFLLIQTTLSVWHKTIIVEDSKCKKLRFCGLFKPRFEHDNRGKKTKYFWQTCLPGNLQCRPHNDLLTHAVGLNRQVSISIYIYIYQSGELEGAQLPRIRGSRGRSLAGFKVFWGRPLPGSGESGGEVHRDSEVTGAKPARIRGDPGFGGSGGEAPPE